MYYAIAYGRPGTPIGGYMDDVGGPLDQKAILGLTAWLNEVEGVPRGHGGVEPVAGAAPIPDYSRRESLVAALPNDGTWIVAYSGCPRAAADSLHRKLKEASFKNVALLWEGFGG